MTRNPWFQIGLDSWALGVDASAVIGLRVMKIAAGDAAAQAESQLMVVEKVEAALDLQTKLLTGALGATPAAMAAKTLKHYGRKVRANRRRLSKT